jgi:hypothetical protein
MQEDVIPSLKFTLESQEDLSEIELSFQDNRVSEMTEHFFLFWKSVISGYTSTDIILLVQDLLVIELYQ